LNGRSPIAFPYTSCPERRAIDVYVYAASQPVRQRQLAKFLTTIFHLVVSFVLIMAQRPALLLCSDMVDVSLLESLPKKQKKVVQLLLQGMFSSRPSGIVY